jgi:hypothetical protein
MDIFNLDLIPIVGVLGIVILLVGFTLHDYKIGLVLMPLGMAMVTGTIILRIYIATRY